MSSEDEVIKKARELPLTERMRLLLDRADLTFAECSLAEEWERTMREALAALEAKT